jgi:exodeoxyribonuclease VII small subunit
MDPEPTFEDALHQLEQVVDDLERGAPELSAALKKYERGVTLLGQCQAALEQAERSVALLTGVDAEGNPVTAPFDATASTPPAPSPAPRTRARTTPRADETPEDRSIPF